MYKVEFYDLINKNYNADFKMYFNLLEKKFTIIEFGCGTGRLAKQFIQLGYSVIGIENDPDFNIYLKNLKLSNFEVLSNLNELKIDKEKYNIILPFNVLLYLTIKEIESLFLEIKKYSFNKIIFDIDSIQVAEEDSFTNKFICNDNLHYIETFRLQNNSNLTIYNTIVQADFPPISFTYKLYLHNRIDILNLVRSNFKDYQVFGDFSLSEFNNHSTKIVGVIHG